MRTASDYELNAWIVKPVDFDESKKYPVLMFQYSGPNSQQVLDKYSFDWEQYLAANGIITVCVDGRGTGARGEASVNVPICGWVNWNPRTRWKRHRL